jgi:hypothetical protein
MVEFNIFADNSKSDLIQFKLISTINLSRLGINAGKWMDYTINIFPAFRVNNQL